MEELDINEIWKSADAQANEYYSTIEPSVIAMAKKRSNSTLEKLKRTIIIEWILCLILLIWVLVSYVQSVFVAFVLVLSYIFMSYPYIKLYRQIKKTPAHDTVHCLSSYIDVIDSFIKRLKVFTIGSTLLGFLLAMYMVFVEDGDYWSDKIWEVLFYMIPIILAFSVLMCFVLIGWYIPRFYGRLKKELEELLTGLTSDS